MKIQSKNGTNAEVEFKGISGVGTRDFLISIPEKGIETVAELQLDVLSFLIPGGKNVKFQLRDEDAIKLWKISEPAYQEYQQKKKEEEEREYAPLEAKLPPAPQDGTFQPGQKEQIREKIEKIEREAAKFTGPEDDGIVLRILSNIGKIQKECPHEWKHEIHRGYMYGLRKKVERISTCVVCGKEIHEEVAAEEWREKYGVYA